MMEANQSHPVVPKGNPLRQIPAIWEAQAKFTEDFSYSMGCFRVNFPSKCFSTMASNDETLAREPHFFWENFIAQDSLKSQRTVIGSIGRCDGFRSSLLMFPDTRTSIVALTNGGDLGDAADWAVKLLTQHFFKTTPFVRIVKLAWKESELSKEAF